LATEHHRQRAAFFAGFAAALLTVLGAATATAQSPAPAAAPAPITAPAAPTSPSGSIGNRNASYTDRTPPDQLLMLEAGADKFQARRIPDLSGQPRGAVIVLHDSGQNPSWPFTVAALLDDLPLHGWDTMSIELPAPNEMAKPIPSNTNAATTSPTTPAAPPAQAPAANGSIPTTQPAAKTDSGVEPQVQARITAAVKYFSDQKQTNVVLIGIGSGAVRGAELIRQMAGANAEKSTAPITTVILIAPRNSLPGIELDLPKILPTTEIPVLDITLDSEPLTRADAELRRRAVLHQRTRVYRQMALSPINNTSDAQHSVMIKRIRAWLQRDEQVSADK